MQMEILSLLPQRAVNWHSSQPKLIWLDKFKILENYDDWIYIVPSNRDVCSECINGS